MTTDDIIDMLETATARSARSTFNLIATTWARNEGTARRDDESAAWASFRLRSDIAKLWSSKIREIGERVRMTYTYDHPLYRRFNHVVATVLNDLKDDYLHQFFTAAMELKGYVPKTSNYKKSP